MPLLRERATDTAALCVNCDARYASGVLVTAAIAEGASDMSGRGSNGDVPAGAPHAAFSSAAGQPSPASRLGPMSAARHDPNTSNQQPEGWRHHDPEGEDTALPAPRAVPPTALRPRDPAYGRVSHRESQSAAVAASPPATVPQNSATGIAGPSAEGLGPGVHTPAADAANMQANPGFRTVHSTTTAVFAATEPPLPRMFPRTTAEQAYGGVMRPNGDSMTGGETVDSADDDFDDNECAYSPTADLRLGPFARDAADRAPATPDRC